MEANTQTNQTGDSLLKKITLKDCGAKPDLKALIEHEAKHGAKAVYPLLRIIGMASDYKTGQTKTGEFVKFLGMFRATNLQTGQVYKSGACILPGAAPDMLYGALRSLGDSGGSVEFCFDVGVHYDDTAIVKYVYDIRQVHAPGQHDPLAALEGKYATPALAAPEGNGDGEAGAAGKKRLKK